MQVVDCGRDKGVVLLDHAQFSFIKEVCWKQRELELVGLLLLVNDEFEHHEIVELDKGRIRRLT